MGSSTYRRGSQAVSSSAGRRKAIKEQEMSAMTRR